jgi:hypothetical protein
VKIRYRKAFLKDLKKLKNAPVYDEIFELAFTALPEALTLREISSVRAMRACQNRYRIRARRYN